MNLFNTETWKTLEVRWGSGFEQLLPEEQEAIALFWLEGETMNGTLNQFFGNSSGDLALLALSGLKSLKMPITLEAFESALQYFGDRYPIDCDERATALKAIKAEHGDDVFTPATRVIQELPERFFEAAVDRLEKVYSEAGLHQTAVERWRSVRARGGDTAPKRVNPIDWAKAEIEDHPYCKQPCPECGYPNPAYRNSCKKCGFPYSQKSIE